MPIHEIGLTPVPADRDRGDSARSVDKGPVDRGLAAASRRRRRRRLFVVLVVLWLVAAAIAVLLFTGQSAPSTLPGDSAAVPGGVARISAVIPLESDGWLPAERPSLLNGPVLEGAHRVRVQLDLTALDPAGLTFSAADYSIAGLGAGRPEVLWASPEHQVAAQGESVQATLVFELPDKAIALVLEGTSGTRLSLGAGHHTGGR